jgi:NADH-quinone oxidoreductase subunit M
MDILSLFVVIPLLTVIAILFARTAQQTRIISAVGMTIQLLNAVRLVVAFFGERAAGNKADFLFQQSYTWFASLNINYAIGIDGMGVVMTVLTAIIVFAGIFASWTINDLPKEYFISLILLAMGVFGFFICLDLFTMFVFYEIAVLPMYLLIGIWGSGTKEYSAMKLTLMLMGGSAFLMVGLIGLYFYSAPNGGAFTFNIIELAKVHMPIEAQRFFFPLTFVGFGVLGALFPFHTWSPDGHASAPTAVSMLHAGVLMKLGSYGAFRVAMYLMPEAANEMSWFFLILVTISVVYGALGAVVQKDLKYINAYSSVSHCGLILFGILMMNKTALDGAILQMVSHGIMTALFFALIGMIYGRTHTRIITEMGGLLKVMPFLSAAYVIAGLASLGLPGLSGFVAEMTIFVGSFQHPDLFHRLATIIATTAIVITAVYILRVVGMLLQGPVRNEKFLSLKDASWFEKVAIVTLILGIVGVGVFPYFVSDIIMQSIDPMMDRIISAGAAASQTVAF